MSFTNIFCLVLFSFFTATAAAQLQTIQVPAGHDIQTINGPHLAYLDTSVDTTGYLLLSFAGTGSPAHQFNRIHRLAAELGFVGLALDYPNHVITTTCRNQVESDPTEPNCFDAFRAEIMTGQDLSKLVQVNPANSIESRIQDALQTLKQQHPERWSRFINEDGTPYWQRIVVVGHSQGAGHAAYLAKRHPLHAVLMSAGPQDHRPRTGPAPWILSESETTPSRYFSFLHREDFFGSESQILLGRHLRKEPEAKIAVIKTKIDSDENAPILVTKQKVNDAHNSMVTEDFDGVWQHLLKRTLRLEDAD